MINQFRNFSKWGWFKHYARVIHNWNINITTRSRNWERSMNLGDLILEMFGKRIAEWISWIMSGQRNRSLSTESPIYTVPELMRFVRVVGDHIPIKVRFSLLHLQKWHGLVYLDLLSCVRDFLLICSKYQWRTLALIISGDIHGAGGLIFMDFDLTGACLSSKVLSVVLFT